MGNKINRREFLSATTITGLGILGGWPGWLLRTSAAQAASLISAASALLPQSPISDITGAFVSGVFNGDDATHPHDALWDKEYYIRSKGGRPTTYTSTQVAIVGGGMSGLLSAYRLRDLSPYVIEQAQRFGGNSKGERFQGEPFSLGAAYVTIPEKGGEIEGLFKELGLAQSFRHESTEESRVCFKGLGLRNLWNGGTDGAARGSALEVEKELARIAREAFPNIPWTSDSPLSQEEFRKLDQESAQQWLHRKFPNLHPHVEEYFQLYCWSSFAGSLEELSAAQFLNFVAEETEGVIALPGGNSAIGEALLRVLANKLPPENLQTGSLVLEVKNVGSNVEVLFEDNTGKLRLLRAQAAIVAAPKYVARYIVPEISHERDSLWKGLPYRAYVVANVLLKQPVTSSAYDVFSLEGKIPPAPSFETPAKDRPWADFVFAGWANHSEKASVLTFYKPFPFEGARNLINDDVGHKRLQGELQAALPATLKDLGIPADAVAGIRLTRWGHALPLARMGLASDASFALIGAPQGKIAFANQDNCMNPAFETCFAAAVDATLFVRKQLGSV